MKMTPELLTEIEQRPPFVMSIPEGQPPPVEFRLARVSPEELAAIMTLARKALETSAPSWYTRVLKRDERGVVAWILELPGCTSRGSDDAEALARSREMEQTMIRQRQEHGLPVPKPLTDLHVLERVSALQASIQTK
jgi:predicted RNase H-like HicB family nuclease